eukprot:9125362-Pyramimonas_sp.AAC.1
MAGQGEDESDGQSEEEILHSMEKNKEYAQCHTSPGPSHHPRPLQGESNGLASGAMLDSDDDLEEERSPDSGGVGRGRGSPSAQPVANSPDAARPARHAREQTRAIPLPKIKKTKSDIDDLNLPPLSKVLIDKVPRHQVL